MPSRVTHDIFEFDEVLQYVRTISTGDRHHYCNDYLMIDVLVLY